jgi:hypothetical protein
MGRAAFFPLAQQAQVKCGGDATIVNSAGACPMHRRDFNLGILKMSAAALLSERLLAPPLANATENTPPSITTLYKNAIVIDTLCAPFISSDVQLTPDILSAIRHSGITAINFTVSELKFEDTV